MKYSDIKFIAYEGGGGKGVIYLGALRALELNGSLLMHPDKRNGDNGDKVILTSAGAITAFFVALGANTIK